MNEKVRIAIEEIQAAFPEANCVATPDGQGGAHVYLDPVPVGPRYSKQESWIGFHVTFQYPYADVYPHYVRHDITRADGKPLGEAFHLGQQFQGRSAVMVSRRSNRLNPATDTALLKLQKVLQWVSTRP